MPAYSFQDIIDSSLDRMTPGAKVLLGSFHRSPGGGVTVAPGVIREVLKRKDGRFKAMCGATVVGKDNDAVDK